MQLATLHLDTYRVVKLLVDRGFDEKQAEGFIEAMQEITLAGVATTQGLQDVKENLENKIQAVDQKVQDLREEMQPLILFWSVYF